MRIRFTLTFLIFLPVLSWCQEVNLEQFYYSDYEPVELNRSETKYIDSFLIEYEKTHKKSKYINNRDFVYEYNYFIKELNRSGKIFYENEIGNYLNKLKDFILDKEEDRNRIHIYLIDDTDLNAFTNDFGNIYVHIGAIARIQSEEELLFLLAHEISHVLLSHSRSKQVSENVARRSLTYGNSYDADGFSRANEQAADINAIKLLVNKIDLERAAGIFDRLNESSNPVLDGKIDFSILTFGDERRTAILDSLFNSLQNFEVLSKDSIEEELSTHPSIDVRVQMFADEIAKVNVSTVGYEPSADFDKIRAQARHILLRSYMFSEEFIEGLDLVCKMRKEDPTDLFLIHTQLRFLTLITQEKYCNDLANQFIGFKGTSCSDENYLHFKVLLLKLSNIDFNEISLAGIRSALKTFDLEEKSSFTEKANYQMLYLNNEELFTISDTLLRYNDDFVYTAIAFNDSVDKSEITRLEKAGFKYIEKFDTTFFHDLFKGQTSLTKLEENIISEVKQNTEPILKVNYYRSEVVEQTDDDSDDLILRPDRAAKKYKRGVFQRSPNFDPAKKAALMESSFIYLNSVDSRFYSIDFEKTIHLSEQLEEFISKDSSIHLDLSNSSKSGVSITDNYIHGLMQRWMDEKLSEDKVVYSSVEDEINQFLGSMTEQIDYLVLNLCIVNKNKGKGTRNNQTFYQIYFDVKLNEAVYIAAIGSKQRITEFQLDQFVYLSNIKKIE